MDNKELEKVIISEDIKKLHSEINQLLNQRFLIITSTIAIIGAIGGWAIGKGVHYYLPCSLFLNIIILSLFTLNVSLKKKISVYSSYLCIKGYSIWESDWKNYRKIHKKFSYTSIQAWVFFLVNLIQTSLFCFISYIDNRVTFVTNLMYYVVLLLVFSLLLVVIAKCFSLKTKEEEKWKQVLLVSENAHPNNRREGQ